MRRAFLGPICAISLLGSAPSPAAESGERRFTDAQLDARMERIAKDAVERMTGAEAVPQLPYEAQLREAKNAYPDAQIEDVSLTVPGLRLSAWMVKPAEGVKVRGTVLALHPWQSNRSFGLDHYGFLLEYGFQLFIPDARSNAFIGRGDVYNAYIKEDLEDLDRALEYLEGRDDVGEIVAYGCAWGAMKAILMGARSSEIKAVISDASTLHYGLILVDYMNKMPPEARKDWSIIQRYIGKVEAKLAERVGYSIDAFDPRAAIRQLDKPVLLLHGADDTYVPIAVSEQLFEAAKEPKSFVRGESFGHCEGMNKEPGRYQARVVLFLERALTN